MAQTLQNFVVGIGLDTKDFKKGAKEVDSNLGLIKSRILLTSAAVAGAFGLAFTAAVNAGNRIDQIALASAKLDTSAKFVNDYGNALRLLGGDASESLASLNAVEDALAQFRVKGSFSAFEDPALAGVDVQALSQAKNGEEFLRMLSDMLPGLNKDQQRLIQQNFGFSDATMASLRNGSKYFDEIVGKAEMLAPGFENSVEAARKFNQQLTEINLKFEGIGNKLAEKILGPLGNFIEDANNFMSENGWRIDKAAEVAGKSPVGSTIAAAGLGTALTGQLTKFVGLRTLGAGLSRIGGAGTLIGGGMIAASLDEKDIEKATGVKLPKWLFTPVNQLGIGDKINSWGVDFTGGLTGKGKGNPYASETVPYGFFNYPSSQKSTQPQEITVNSNLHLDGQVIDSRITKVQVLRDKSTLEDIKTTTAR